MSSDALRVLLREIRAAVRDEVPEAHLGRIVIGFSEGGVGAGSGTAPDGTMPVPRTVELSFDPAGATGPFPGGKPTVPEGGAEVRSIPGRNPGDAGSEEGAGGNIGTLRRRLELVLGGRPGFHTGARAEVLIDLLEEFGRGALVEALRRDWVSQFDTGPEASASVTKAGEL